MLNKKQLISVLFTHVLKAGIAVLLAVVVIVFTGTQIGKVTKSLQQKRALDSVFEKRSETVLVLEKDLQIVGDKDKKIQAALLSSDNILEFVGILESLANQYALQQNLKFGIPVAVPSDEEGVNLASIDYNITLQGNVSTLEKYLADFEKLPYFTHASSVSLTTQSPQGWDDNSNITIQAKLYVRSK